MEKIDILYISANPKGTVDISTEKEYSEIQDAVARGKHRDLFNPPQPLFHSELKKLANMLSSSMKNRCILHFSGHGNQLGDFLLEQDNSEDLKIAPKNLAEYLDNYKNKILGIVFSACYSDDLARAANKKSEYFTIGFENSISVQAAKLFSYQFYLGLLDTLEIEKSYNTALSLSRLPSEFRHTANFYEGNIDTIYSIENFKQQKEALEEIIELEKNEKTDSMLNDVKKQILKYIEEDIERAFDLLDEKFGKSNGLYNDLSKEYEDRPQNFQMSTYRSKLKRFVKRNM